MSKFIERFVSFAKEKGAKELAFEAKETLNLGLKTRVALQELEISDLENQLRKAKKEALNALANFGHEVSDRDVVILNFLEAKNYVTALTTALEDSKNLLTHLKEAVELVNS